MFYRLLIIEAGGYIWHTTGSGKTLTSFKTAQLASQLPYIDKVLFVVGRKDLDYQTMKEYDRFEKSAATGTRAPGSCKSSWRIRMGASSLLPFKSWIDLSAKT